MQRRANQLDGCGRDELRDAGGPDVALEARGELYVEGGGEQRGKVEGGEDGEAVADGEEGVGGEGDGARGGGGRGEELGEAGVFVEAEGEVGGRGGEELWGA